MAIHLKYIGIVRVWELSRRGKSVLYGWSGRNAEHPGVLLILFVFADVPVKNYCMAFNK